MRVVFMGTPEIAAGILRTLIASRHEVVGVVTQPDRPNARGNEIIFSDVKKVALEYSIPVFQPEKASEETFVEKIRELAPDIIVVAAYGQILRENILNLPRYRCINVHASILPKYRGASPIQWAVINGEKETGVTIMYMEKGLDTGDMILTRKIELAPDETAGSLHDRLMELGGPTLLEAMDMIENGTAHPVPQNNDEATYVGMLKKSMGELDFNNKTEYLERLIRGLIPWPGAYTYINGRMLKIWKAVIPDVCGENAGKENEGNPAGCRLSGKPGRLFTEGEGLYVETADGCLELLEVQLEGKKRMTAGDFLRGFKIEENTLCGNVSKNA
ncbi:MAG: methionyl-tRNA formyltransferase [Lachnospiraceae bacterium]|nr:methionyl-tRNA formyltransferase [Lachnospiraceae bacterium]